MSIPDTNGSSRNGGVKTLAIRLEPDLHQQLSLIAQLQNTTITDEIRTAIEERITRLKNLPEIAAKADEVLAAIEADAAARRGAIATLFGDSTATDEPGSKTASRSRARRRTPSSEGGNQA